MDTRIKNIYVRKEGLKKQVDRLNLFLSYIQWIYFLFINIIVLLNAITFFVYRHDNRKCFYGKMLGLFQLTKTRQRNSRKLGCLYLCFKETPSFYWLCYKKIFKWCWWCLCPCTSCWLFARKVRCYWLHFERTPPW